MAARRAWCSAGSGVIFAGSIVRATSGAMSAGRGGGPPGVPQTNGTARSPSLIVALDDIWLPGCRTGHEQPFLFELARDGDDLVLRLLDFAQADRAEHFHLFADQV